MASFVAPLPQSSSQALGIPGIGVEVDKLRTAVETVQEKVARTVPTLDNWSSSLTMGTKSAWENAQADNASSAATRAATQAFGGLRQEAINLVKIKEAGSINPGPKQLTTEWDVNNHRNGFGTNAQFKGETITLEEANRRLDSELSLKAKEVDDWSKQAGVKLSEGWRTAMVDLTFNGGIGSWKGNGLDKALRAGDMQDAESRYRQYDVSDGKHLSGLAERRADMMRMKDAIDANGASARVNAGETALLTAAQRAEGDTASKAAGSVDLFSMKSGELSQSTNGLTDAANGNSPAMMGVTRTMIEQTGNANGLTGAYQKLGKAQKDAYNSATRSKHADEIHGRETKLDPNLTKKLAKLQEQAEVQRMLIAGDHEGVRLAQDRVTLEGMVTKSSVTAIRCRWKHSRIRSR